jgi:hypothetical protein
MPRRGKRQKHHSADEARRGKRKKHHSADEADQTPAEKRASMTWAKRLKRVFHIEIEPCSECGGDVRIIAGIEDPAGIRSILATLEQKGELFTGSLLPDGLPCFTGPAGRVI